MQMGTNRVSVLERDRQEEESLASRPLTGVEVIMIRRLVVAKAIEAEVEVGRMTKRPSQEGLDNFSKIWVKDVVDRCPPEVEVGTRIRRDHHRFELSKFHLLQPVRGIHEALHQTQLGVQRLHRVRVRVRLGRIRQQGREFRLRSHLVGRPTILDLSFHNLGVSHNNLPGFKAILRGLPVRVQLDLQAICLIWLDWEA